jgi:hypothetical protein
MRRVFVETNLVRIFLVASLVCMDASAGSKEASSTAKLAAPAAKSAAPSKPAATGIAATSAASRSGATMPAAGRTGGGITTANPSGRAGGGITTANSAGRGTATPSAANTGARPNVGGTAGSRPVQASSISHTAPAGSRTTRAANGSEVRTRANGQRSDVHDAKRNIDIHNGLDGDRRISVERADHSRVVAERGGRGYVQRPYTFRGHEYGHRTYYFHGRAYDRFYRPYLYNGIALDIYAPALYYPVGFYSYAYYPWAAPVPYAWGFAGNPWYGYYGGYFVPAPAYPNASVWLTDYMISNSLADSYQARVDAGLPVQPLPVASQAPLSPEVRAAIAEEVNRQIALETAEAQGNAQNQEPNPQSSSIAGMMSDGQRHTFVVGQDLDLTDISGKECLVTAGDVLQLLTPPPAGADGVNLVVLSNKGVQECGKSTTVGVALSDLQNMQNQMRERIDQGLGQLQAKGGKGLSAEPATAAGPATPALFTQGAPPEPNVASEIAEQEQEADRAQAEAGQAAQLVSGGSGLPPAPDPKQLSTGMSENEVTGILGPPKSIANVGPKKMYVYADMKVTIIAGKVTNIQ